MNRPKNVPISGFSQLLIWHDSPETYSPIGQEDAAEIIEMVEGLEQDKEKALRLIAELSAALKIIDEETHWADRDEDEDFISDYESIIKEADAFLVKEGK